MPAQSGVMCGWELVRANTSMAMFEACLPLAACRASYYDSHTDGGSKPRAIPVAQPVCCSRSTRVWREYRKQGAIRVLSSLTYGSMSSRAACLGHLLTATQWGWRLNLEGGTSLTSITEAPFIPCSRIRCTVGPRAARCGRLAFSCADPVHINPRHKTDCGQGAVRPVCQRVTRSSIQRSSQRDSATPAPWHTPGTLTLTMSTAERVDSGQGHSTSGIESRVVLSLEDRAQQTGPSAHSKVRERTGPIARSGLDMEPFDFVESCRLELGPRCRR